MTAGCNSLAHFRHQAEIVREEIGSVIEAELADSPEFKGMVVGALQAQRKGNALEGARWLLLTLAACEGVGGDWRDAVPAAAAMELFITAGDLFDDIEDRDTSPSDVPHSTNVASALLLLSEKVAFKLRDGKVAGAVLRAISAAGIRSCAGQYYDLRFEDAESLSEESWMRMTGLRSGSLMECACRAGAIAGTLDEQKIEAFARFGWFLGVAAQISNDLQVLNTTSTKSDMVCRKKTFPLVFALNAANGVDRQLLQAYCAGSGEPEAIRSVLKRLGAFYYSTIVTEEYRLRAFQVLKDAGVDPQDVARFEMVTTVRG